MATPTYDLIETTTLDTAASSVTFSSITQDYRDLVLVIDCELEADATLEFRINGDTSSIYSYVSMSGEGSDTRSFSGTSNAGFVGRRAQPAPSQDFLAILQFMDYSVTDKHTTILQRANDTSRATEAIATRYGATTAVTSISLFNSSWDLLTGSTFSLYGIAA